MKCYLHPEADSIGTCTSCGRSICGECVVELQGRLVCRDCLAQGKIQTKSYDPNTAFLIELIGGFFGILGLGYLYTGRTNDGILRLIIWILYDIIAAVAITLLMTVFIGILCIPVQLVIQVGVPIWSASTLKNQLIKGV
jgi:TM2 domain-containing membrane protein YozV